MKIIQKNILNSSKLECRLKTIEDVQQFLSDLNGIKSGKVLEVVLDLNEYTPELLSNIKDGIIKVNNISVNILVENKRSKIKVKDLESFIDFEDNLNNNNKELYFIDGREYYTLTETINAEEQIEKFVTHIKSCNASPFEQYLMIYNFLTQKVYNENEQNRSQSRDVIAVLNGDNIVCVGYASLMKRLCDEIGIECYTQTSSILSSNGEYLGGHQNNVVVLNDEKYGINGMFYADACWDSVERNKEHRSAYNFCLVPLSDKNKLKNEQVMIDYSSFTSLFYNDKNEQIEMLSFFDTFCSDINVGDITEKEEKEIKSIFLSNKKRTRACTRLDSIFNKYNIPADIYTYNIQYPDMCSHNYILALLMEDKIDSNRLFNSMELLAQIVKEKNNFNCHEEFKKSFTAPNETNIYSTINELKKAQTITETETFEYDESYTEEEFFEALDKQDIEKLKLMNTKVVKVKNEPQVPYSWLDSQMHLQNIHKARELEKTLKQKKQNNTVIDYNSFKNGIKQSLIFSGYDEKTAQKLTELALERTLKRSEIIYSSDAINCFSTTQKLIRLNPYESEQ